MNGMLHDSEILIARLFAAQSTQYSVRSIDLVRRSVTIDMMGIFTVNAAREQLWFVKSGDLEPRGIAAIQGHCGEVANSTKPAAGLAAGLAIGEWPTSA